MKATSPASRGSTQRASQACWAGTVVPDGLAAQRRELVGQVGEHGLGEASTGVAGAGVRPRRRGAGSRSCPRDRPACLPAASREGRARCIGVTADDLFEYQSIPQSGWAMPGVG